MPSKNRECVDFWTILKQICAFSSFLALGWSQSSCYVCVGKCISGYNWRFLSQDLFTNTLCEWACVYIYFLKRLDIKNSGWNPPYNFSSSGRGQTSTNWTVRNKQMHFLWWTKKQQMQNSCLIPVRVFVYSYFKIIGLFLFCDAGSVILAFRPFNCSLILFF